MGLETVHLRPRHGDATDGTGDIQHLSATRRGVTATLWVVLGLAGIGTIVIPGVHFIAPWLCPLLGVWMAVQVWGKTHIVTAVSGPCPHCGHAVAWADVTMDTHIWERCSHCGDPIEIIVPPVK